MTTSGMKGRKLHSHIALRGGYENQYNRENGNRETSSNEGWVDGKLEEDAAAIGNLPWDDEPESSSEEDLNAKFAEEDKEKLPWECYYGRGCGSLSQPKQRTKYIAASSDLRLADMAEKKLDVDELHRSTASPVRLCPASAHLANSRSLLLCSP
jgi:hypothetical protein